MAPGVLENQATQQKGSDLLPFSRVPQGLVLPEPDPAGSAPSCGYGAALWRISRTADPLWSCGSHWLRISPVSTTITG
jgi:hypothetical protein